MLLYSSYVEGKTQDTEVWFEQHFDLIPLWFQKNVLKIDFKSNLMRV